MDRRQLEVLNQVDSPGKTAFAFRLSGRYVGPLVTPLGVIAPTERSLSVLGIDIFVLDNDQMIGVWAVADYLGLLIQAAAVISASSK